jgi:hypothetical protein
MVLNFILKRKDSVPNISLRRYAAAFFPNVNAHHIGIWVETKARLSQLYAYLSRSLFATDVVGS